MDPNFGSIKMTLIFQKDCITSMDPKFGSINMTLIFQKDWITSMDPKFGSINMTSIFQKPVKCNAVIAVVQGVQLVSSGLNINVRFFTKKPKNSHTFVSKEAMSNCFCKELKGWSILLPQSSFSHV